ncbi:MAG: efflux RND transporter periplasmic adaptor subunit [Candidatus Sungbacteria bacterium]|nr:efflux RND transporter periplasmic adaptor subunit [Candidatus Sungbacteria bacterium]
MFQLVTSRVIHFIKHLSLTSKVIAAAGLLAVLGGGGYFLLSQSAEPETVRVEIRDLTQVVTVTGTVKPPVDIQLEFLSSGRVAFRPVTIGSRVQKNSVLMALDARDLDIQVQGAEAALSGTRAKLEQLEAGATFETIRQLENAVHDAYQDALLALDNSLTKADKGIVTLRNSTFTPANKVRDELALPPDARVAKLENVKNLADARLSALHTKREEVPATGWSQALLAQLFSDATPALDAVREIMVLASEALVHVVSPWVTQTTLAVYLSDLAAARTEFDSASRSFTSAVSDIQSAKDALEVKKEPPREVDIQVFRANVKSAEADLALLKKKKSDTVIVAPIESVVTDLAYEVGESARSGVTAVSLIAAGHAEVEALVPEVDIGKVAVGNPVSITLDAYPEEMFSGSVIHVNPAETVVDGVTNFRIRVAIDNGKRVLKTGVTANLSIETMRKKGTVALSQLGIIERDEGTFVKKIQDGVVEEISVKTGVRGSDGHVEILSGLRAGDTVINAGLKANR